MSLPRKVRKEINLRVEDFEDLDLTKMDFTEFSNKLAKIRDFLDTRGVCSESEYRERLKIVETEARKFYSPKDNAQTNNTVYIGYYDSKLVEVIQKQDLMVLRDFGYLASLPQRLTWGFNKSGRLKFFGTKSYNGKTHSNLLAVLDNDLPNDWNSTIVSSNPLPEVVFKLTKLPQGSSFISAYEKLIQRGHITANNLLRSINAGLSEKINKYHSYQKSLDEMIGTSTYEYLLNVQSIFPFLEYTELGNGRYRIVYGENKFDLRKNQS